MDPACAPNFRRNGSGALHFRRNRYSVLPLIVRMIVHGYKNPGHLEGFCYEQPNPANMPCEPGPSGRLRLHLLRIEHRLIKSLDVQFWSNIYSLEVPPNESLSKVLSLLSCPAKIAVARSFRGNEAQKLVDFLDRVRKFSAPCFSNLGRCAQVLALPCLDDKPRQRCLRLLSNICEARRITPASYVLQQELIHAWRVRCHGGFADVSDGEYLGRPVAIKRLKMNGGDSDRIFKVRLCNRPRMTVTQLSPSGCAERSSVGNICPIRTSCPCWGFLCL